MNILKLFADYPFIPSFLDSGKEITDIVYDSRKARPDTIFVAMRGANRDGHDSCMNAYENGCRDFVVEHRVTLPNDAITYLVADSRRALSVMSRSLFQFTPKEEKKLVPTQLIAVTGTKGKTSTCMILRSILEAAGRKVGYIGTLGVMYDGKVLETPNTTPESYEIFRHLRQMRLSGCEYVLIEASSQGVKLHRTADLCFNLGVFTNLSPDHIGPGEHESFEEYLACKRELFSQCALSIGNIDDEYYEQVVSNRFGRLTFGLSEKADYRAEDTAFTVSADGFSTVFTCREKGKRHELKLKLPGMFSVYNALGAIAVARNYGGSYETIQAGLSAVRVKGRTEIVPDTGDVRVLLDYAHNELSVKSLFDMLLLYKPKRLIAVFGCGGNRSKLRRYAMGEIICKTADFSVITSDNPRDEDVGAIIEDIKQGAGEYIKKAVVVPDRREAIEYALSLAGSGDIVAIVGKGDQDYEEIKGVRHPFDERRIVADYFKNASK